MEHREVGSLQGGTGLDTHWKEMDAESFAEETFVFWLAFGNGLERWHGCDIAIVSSVCVSVCPPACHFPLFVPISVRLMLQIFLFYLLFILSFFFSSYYYHHFFIWKHLLFFIVFLLLLILLLLLLLSSSSSLFFYVSLEETFRPYNGATTGLPSRKRSLRHIIILVPVAFSQDTSLRHILPWLPTRSPPSNVSLLCLQGLTGDNKVWRDVAMHSVSWAQS